jgi:serine protease Do
MQIRTVKRLLIAAAITTAAGAAAYAGYSGDLAARATQANNNPAPTASAVQPSPALPAGVPDFSAIVSRYGPAVVNVSVKGKMKAAAEEQAFPQMSPGDPFYEFFRHFQFPQNQPGIPVRGFGSGFIVSPDGIILTNAHVVAGADEVTVKLTDKREFTAKVIGMDKATDVAVLRINARDLPVVRIGDPSQAHVGSWVLAIGSPFGFENSATAGIVSAKSRSLPDEGYVPFIQTDVAVNPGNSGGPLFDSAGEVIGINSQIYTRTGGYEGLSFAIPIDVAMKIQQQLLAHGKVSHGLLGVTVQEVSQSLAQAFGLPKPEGALVSSVQADGPAAKAGLRAGDVILAFNGSEISRSSDLPPLVIALEPGTSVKLKIWRDGASRNVDVALGDFNKAQVAVADEESGKGAQQGRLGVAVRPLTPDERRQDEVSGGLLVESVSGAAARAGIQPGDVILAVNGQAIASASHLRNLVTKAGKHLALLVKREDAKIFVPVDLG